MIMLRFKHEERDRHSPASCEMLCEFCDFDISIIRFRGNECYGSTDKMLAHIKHIHPEALTLLMVSDSDPEVLDIKTNKTSTMPGCFEDVL